MTTTAIYVVHDAEDAWGVLIDTGDPADWAAAETITDTTGRLLVDTGQATEVHDLERFGEVDRAWRLDATPELWTVETAYNDGSPAGLAGWSPWPVAPGDFDLDGLVGEPLTLTLTVSDSAVVLVDEVSLGSLLRGGYLTYVPLVFKDW